MVVVVAVCPFACSHLMAELLVYLQEPAGTSVAALAVKSNSESAMRRALGLMVTVATVSAVSAVS